MASIDDMLNAAWTAHQTGRLKEAEQLYQQLLTREPRNIQASERLGVCYFDQRRPAEAVELYQRALELDPGSASVFNNLGNALNALGRRDEALASFNRAIQLQPGFVLAYKNKSSTYWSAGEIELALRNHEELVAYIPNDPDVRSQIGIMRLMLGDYVGGWPEFEWRWQTGQLHLPQLPRPLWDGRTLDGRTILLWPEQGLGDYIQFIRYASWLKQRYQCRVLAYCPARLRALLNCCEGIDLWVDDPLQDLPPFDCYAPLMHVPGVLRQAPFSANVPYLVTNKRLVEQWKQILARYDRLKIGIAWHGNPAHESDDRRSIPLSEFAKLAQVDGVQLFSLQKGAGSEELSDFRGIIDPAPDLDETTGAFVETAAILQNLDLLITCDTAIAHVAGALARPVWVALCKVPDWRWGLTGESTPWYPTMRLFRQPVPDDWSTVMDHILLAVRQQFFALK